MNSIYTLRQIKDGTGFAKDAKFVEYTDYQGWTNYETWCVGLWIDNDEGTSRERARLVDVAWADAEADPDRMFTQSETALYRLAETLKTWVTDELVPDLGATFAADLLGAALAEVNWRELADTWLKDYVADYLPTSRR